MLYDRLHLKHRQNLNELHESFYYQQRVERVKSLLQKYERIIDMTVEETHDCFCILEPSKSYDLKLFYDAFYDIA